jgi:hypothetical protein
MAKKPIKKVETKQKPELTAAQKKLPPALQAALLSKMKNKK